MIKATNNYLMLTPSGNTNIIAGQGARPTQFTAEELTGTELKEKLETLQPIQVTQMVLFEVKTKLKLEPVTTINVSSASKGKGDGRKKAK